MKTKTFTGILTALLVLFLMVLTAVKPGVSLKAGDKNISDSAETETVPDDSSSDEEYYPDNDEPVEEDPGYYEKDEYDEEPRGEDSGDIE